MTELNKKSRIIVPVDLVRMARSVANSYVDTGAIILVSGDEGIRIGVWGLTDRETQDALCVGIHHNIRRICEN
jgi:hypothetical protein